jgi:predicted nucleic acid-binding protein
LNGEKVLDSWALLCYLEREAGFEKIIQAFEEAVHSSRPLWMTMVNWGEVYYQVARRFGEERAQEIETLIDTFPIALVDIDRDLAREAARFKAKKKMAYADCFAAALAKQRKAELYTGDPEFKAVVGEIKIHWLKQE